MMKMTILRWADLDAAARKATLQRPAMTNDANHLGSVTAIVEQVRTNGDQAVRDLTAKYDGAALHDFRVSPEEASAAEAQLSSAAIAAIDVAIRNVRTFHAAQMPSPIAVQTTPGVSCERVSHAIDAVGLYVPAGTAPLPSAAIMLAVPAEIAGCPTRIMCTPPRADGTADPAVLVAARRAGVSEIYKIGGAQAIAAMAYGTESIPKVCKIFGPGNSWVTAAKSIVASDAGGAAIDMPAGPSEVLVIADAEASPAFVAADLLSQAEHGVDSQVILLTDSLDVANRVRAEISSQLETLSRANIAAQSLANSRIIIVEDIESAVQISNSYAPEHLILQLEDARSWLASIRNAGSVFVGPWAPESVGDYCSGTNHVLPTYGFARSYSGLGVDQFLRQMTVQELSADGLVAIADSVIELAGLEGLDAHAAAIKIRLEALL
jgi:histidinol dehydrogenase